MKGIVMAGGRGSRLYPITSAVSKHLLPIYDKPMIYYSISVLMIAGVRDILIICNPQDLVSYQRLLGNGQRYGINLRYATQSEPRGIAEAFIIGANFIGDDNNIWLILGDNLFYGQGLSNILRRAMNRHQKGATVFAYPVSKPGEFGVIEFDDNGHPIRLLEKPKDSHFTYAVTGLYLYDNQVLEMAHSICPSVRGELEITAINQLYLEKGELRVEMLGRGMAWLDAGTPERLLEASEFVHTLQKRQGFKIACLEEIAWRKGWISRFEFDQKCESEYSQYLAQISRSHG